MSKAATGNVGELGAKVLELAGAVADLVRRQDELLARVLELLDRPPSPAMIAGALELAASPASSLAPAPGGPVTEKAAAAFEKLADRVGSMATGIERMLDLNERLAAARVAGREQRANDLAAAQEEAGSVAPGRA